jgi:hypothetical protein
MATEYNFVKEMGCLAHPQAREYLMRGILTELKRLEDSAEYPISQIYAHCIDLIVDGVPK